MNQNHFSKLIPAPKEAANYLRQALKLLAPYGLVEWRRQQLAHAAYKISDSRRHNFHRDRWRAIEKVNSGINTSGTEIPFDYNDAVDYLVSLGVPDYHVREGSIPEASLRFMASHIESHLHRSSRAIGLHIGNFVGISMCYLASILKALHPSSLLIAIDPNITHREISNPQNYAAALATRYHLQSDILPIAAYSNRKSISNDGVVFGNYDPVASFSTEWGFENALGNLKSILGEHFLDFVLADGNHEARYLTEEVNTLSRFIRPGGLLVLDDVDRAWIELREVYLSLNGSDWVDIGTDGRIGVLQRR